MGILHWGFPHTSVNKDSACSTGDPVRFLGQEDPMETEMTTHSSILAWRIPWTEEPGGLQSMGSQESDMTCNQPRPHSIQILLTY